MEDEDTAEGFQWWSAKKEFKITIEFEDEDQLVSHVVYDTNERSRYNHEVHTVGWEESLPSEYQLQHIQVFKRVFPKS